MTTPNYEIPLAERRRNSLIAAGLWLVSSVLSFITLNALIQMFSRIYLYFVSNGIDYQQYMGSVSIQQFTIIPAGIIALVAIIGGVEMMVQNINRNPKLVWKFFSVVLGLEFAVLFLAYKI